MADIAHNVFMTGVMFDMAVVMKWRLTCRDYAMLDHPAELLKWLQQCIVAVTRRYTTCNLVKTPGFKMWCSGCKLRQIDDECDEITVFNASPQRFVGYCSSLEHCQSRLLTGPGIVYNGVAVQISAREWAQMHKSLFGGDNKKTNWRSQALASPRAFMRCLRAYFKHGGHILGKNCGLGVCKCVRAIPSVATCRQNDLVHKGREAVIKPCLGARGSHGNILCLPPVSPLYSYEQCRATMLPDGDYGRKWFKWEGHDTPGSALV